MATDPKTGNFNLDKNSSEGGSVRLTLAAGVGQGNGGVSLPCRFCFVSVTAAATAPTKMNVGAAASAILGVTLAEDDVVMPLKVPIDNVNKLYFYSAGATDIIDITWMI
jgi:hypothetical protein